jgi:hypothetical protein
LSLSILARCGWEIPTIDASWAWLNPALLRALRISFNSGITLMIIISSLLTYLNTFMKRPIIDITMAEDEAEMNLKTRDHDERFWNKRTFKGIITDYVRRKVRGRPWEDRYYIYDLMAIEDYCAKGPTTYGQVSSFRHLSKKYPKEYNGIRSELDPQWPKDRAKREAEEARRAEELLAEHEKSQKELDEYGDEWERRSRMAWQELGGRL